MQLDCRDLHLLLQNEQHNYRYFQLQQAFTRRLSANCPKQSFDRCDSETFKTLNRRGRNLRYYLRALLFRNAMAVILASDALTLRVGITPVPSQLDPVI